MNTMFQGCQLKKLVHNGHNGQKPLCLEDISLIKRQDEDSSLITRLITAILCSVTKRTRTKQECEGRLRRNSKSK